MPPRKPSTRRKKVAALSKGLSAPETAVAAADLGALAGDVEKDGGAVLAHYRDPVGGKPLLLVSLPIDRVEPTPYQRDPSDPHVKRLMGVIEKIGLFLDPIIVVRQDEGYWTPNGNHRLQALKKLGHRAVIALLVPDAARRVQDPRAQHGEGAQPAREVAGDDPHGARAGRGRATPPKRASPSSSSSRRS